MIAGLSPDKAITGTLKSITTIAAFKENDLMANLLKFGIAFGLILLILYVISSFNPNASQSSQSTTILNWVFGDGVCTFLSYVLFAWKKQGEIRAQVTEYDLSSQKLKEEIAVQASPDSTTKE